MRLTLTEQFVSGIQRQGMLWLLWKHTPIPSILSPFRRMAGVSSQPFRIKPSLFILSIARERIFIVFPQCESYVHYGRLSATINDRKQHLLDLCAKGYQL